MPKQRSNAWLAVALLVALSTPAHAQFTFITNNGTITITRYTGPGGVVMIPRTTNGYPVTSIGGSAFYNCISLTSLTIPNSVTSIGSTAFEFCSGLTSVTLPSSVTTIGRAAFWSCSSLTAITVDALNPAYSSLAGVLFNKSQTTLVACPGGKAGNYTIPNSVTSIGYEAFAYCRNLTTVTIGTNVTSIAGFALFGCSDLTTIIIPKSVIYIGSEVFSDCSSLTAITVDALNPAYSSLAGLLFNRSQTTLVACPGGKAGNYTIPNSVANIQDFAFNACSCLTSVTIPNSVTSIGSSAFQGCSGLTSVTIGNSVTSIGSSPFNGCTLLGTITVDALNPAYSSLAGVLFNKSHTTLIDYPCGKVGGSYTIPNSVTRVGDWAFHYAYSLRNITIPSSVTNLGNYAFCDCYSLTNVIIGNGITSIGYGLFSSCSSLKGVYFQGNAPNDPGLTVFSGDNNAIAYYLPGTMNWGSTLGGRPAVLWNPLILTSGLKFGVRTNRFGFNIIGTTNIPIVVEACTDAANASWTPLQSCTLTNGSIYFADSQWSNYPRRFYRIRSP
jgi:hypothetical protein